MRLMKKQSSISLKLGTNWKDDWREKTGQRSTFAHGFEDAGRDDVRKYSPTGGRENLRLLFTLTSSGNQRINTMDIKSAFFVQGNSIERDVFIKPPRG